MDQALMVVVVSGLGLETNGRAGLVSQHRKSALESRRQLSANYGPKKEERGVANTRCMPIESGAMGGRLP